MATVTGLTAEKMLEIEAASIIDGKVVDGDLILIKHDGTEINAGPVDGPSGPPGPAGPPGISAIPGEVKLWSGEALPDPATYGTWVWADGAHYLIADYPLAAAHISDLWNTFAGASDPGASRFRVPDLRGLVAAGMDAMPGGARANRMTRAVAITLAARTGKETHALLIGELARHGHGSVSVSVSVSGSISGSTDAGNSNHQHVHRANHITTGRADGGSNMLTGLAQPGGGSQSVNTDLGGSHTHGVGGTFSGSGSGSGTVPQEGSDNAHENVQPTVMVPYIVCLGG
jgi:microcystin-dependent protein